MDAAWLLAAALAAATPATGNAPVDAFVADLAGGRRDAAIARIYEMNSLSGQPNAVALASEFVDKLMRCTLLSSQSSRFHAEMVELQWRCRDGDYHALLDPGYRPPRIVVAEFISAETREARRRNRAMSPPMPMPPSPNAGPPMSDDEMVRIVTGFLDGIGPGGSAVRASVTFRLHFMDRRQPDAFIGPDQLGRYLASCRRAGPPRVRQSGPVAREVVTHWTCTGRSALDTEITILISPYQGRITGGMVLVGPVPALAP
jgi:hypothetical protein